MVRGTLSGKLYPSYEDTLLQTALQKHVHRFDWREGVKRHQVVDETHAVTDEGKKGPHLTARFSSTRRSSRLTESPKSSRQATEDDASEVPKEQLLALGTLHLQVPEFVGGVVKCRFSGCFDESWNPALVQKLLARRCPWRPSPAIAVGDWTKHASLVHPYDHGNSSACTIAWPEVRAPSRDRSPGRGDEGTDEDDRIPAGCSYKGKRVDQSLDWAFLRHIPLAEQWNITGEGAKLKTQSGKMPSSGVQAGNRAYDVIWSDVAALLEYRLGNPPLNRPPWTVAELATAVPFTTAARWQRIMKLTDSSNKDALIHRLARVLTQKDAWFKVSTNSDALLGADSAVVFMWELRKGSRWSQTKDDLSEAAQQRPFHVGDASRHKYMHSWLATLPVAHGLADSCASLSSRWGMEVNFDRVSTVLCSLERAFSLSLCGGMMASMDCLRIIPADEADRPTYPRRGAKGIDSGWVIHVLSEAADEDHLEEGDSIRLLASEAAKLVGEADFTTKAWLGLCEAHGLRTTLQQRRRFSRGSFSEDDEVEGGADVGCTSSRPLSDSERSQEVRRFHEAETELLSTESGEHPCFGAVTLEAMLQLAARATHKAGGSEELVMTLLWEIVGWDSPAARRLLRRICRAFDRFARNGELFLQGFIKLCHDAGWSTSRDHASKHERLTTIFSELVGFTEASANFMEFMMMVESIMNDFLRPKSSPSGLQTWQAMELAASRLAGGGTTPRAFGGGKTAMTVKQKQNPKRATKFTRQSTTVTTARNEKGKPGKAAQTSGAEEPRRHLSSAPPSEKDMSGAMFVKRASVIAAPGLGQPKASSRATMSFPMPDNGSQKASRRASSSCANEHAGNMALPKLQTSRGQHGGRSP
mmetsp:Transcript_66986/g.187033  ORF Transcript_66986/g.187033 Transcript_66986/m.187033 type:complete len:870 (+) Transcript_66986:158-2767(+)